MAGTVTPTLTPAQILAHLNSLGTSGALFDASVFALKDPSAPTKIGKFSAAGITAGQTRTYTLPDATGTLALLGLAQTWSATQTFGAIDATSIGATTRGTGLFTTIGANGQITSTLATGTAPFVVASTTNVANLNASSLSGATFAAPGAIGSGTPSTGAFTTLSASGVITSTLATGTAPFTVASTTVVGNLNVSQLLGSTWAAPGSIGSGTPAAGAFTTLSASGQITSTLATGTAPFSVASTTNVANLNASTLSGKTHADPGPIGSGTPSTGAFTTLSATGVITSTLATGTAPFTVASTTQVTNLNSSQLIGGTWAIPGAIGATTPNTGKFTTLTVTGYTPTRIPYATTGSTITDNANLAFDDSNFRITAGTMLAGAWTGVGATSMVIQNSALSVAAGNYALVQDNTGNTYLNGASGKVVNINNANNDAARFDGDSTAGNTRCFLYDVTAGALVRVSRGASDSGGAGFRLLRVPN